MITSHGEAKGLFITCCWEKYWLGIWQKLRLIPHVRLNTEKRRKNKRFRESQSLNIVSKNKHQNKIKLNIYQVAETETIWVDKITK